MKLNLINISKYLLFSIFMFGIISCGSSESTVEEQTIERSSKVAPNLQNSTNNSSGKLDNILG